MTEEKPVSRPLPTWHHIACRECDWSRSVQLNASAKSIRRGFEAIAEHFAAHSEVRAALEGAPHDP